jgi:hypothetical protein
MATRQLLERGFAISWMDRYPSPYQPPSQAAQTFAPIGAPQIEQGDEAGGHVTARLEAALQIPAEQGLDISIREVGDKSNRVKYSCPGCKTNVWGKPGLKLICEPCEMRLE